jgi:hypothetical protein
MYAGPVLLAVVILVALVYLPKVRKPMLWLSIAIIAVGGLVVGGYVIKVSRDERAAERLRARELSYLVDHAIGIPNPCKFKPFSDPFDVLLYGDPLAAAAARASGHPFPPPKIVPASEWEEVPNSGSATKRSRKTSPHASAAEEPVGTNKPPEPFDPDAYLCGVAVKELSRFIKDHSDELNDFIQGNQSDPRVREVQMALAANGLEYKKTCKDLIDEKNDDYELHQHGCK